MQAIFNIALQYYPLLVTLFMTESCLEADQCVICIYFLYVYIYIYIYIERETLGRGVFMQQIVCYSSILNHVRHNCLRTVKTCERQTSLGVSLKGEEATWKVKKKIHPQYRRFKMNDFNNAYFNHFKCIYTKRYLVLYKSNLRNERLGRMIQ